MIKHKVSLAKNLVFVFLVVSVLVFRVDSLAVSSVCAPRTPCQMHAGEERIFNFLLQSGVETRIGFELLDDAGGIAQIVGDNEFNIPAGSQNVNARLKVKIPEDAQVGIVNIIIKFTEIPLNNQGQVSLSPSFTLSFPVNVGQASVEESKPGDATWFFVFAVALVLAVLIAISVVLVKNQKDY